MIDVVIVGHDMRDAQAHAMTRRDRDRGKTVRLVSCNNHASRLLGIRVDEWEATDYAKRHPKWPDIYSALAHSQAKQGVKNPSE